MELFIQVQNVNLHAIYNFKTLFLYKMKRLNKNS